MATQNRSIEVSKDSDCSHTKNLWLRDVKAFIIRDLLKNTLVKRCESFHDKSVCQKYPVTQCILPDKTSKDNKSSKHECMYSKNSDQSLLFIVNLCGVATKFSDLRLLIDSNNLPTIFMPFQCGALQNSSPAVVNSWSIIHQHPYKSIERFCEL